jgi:rare lipoprotein A
MTGCGIVLPFFTKQPFRICVFLVLALLSAACGGMTVPHTPPAVAGPSLAPVPEQIFRETGTAAWCGRELHGRKTASGEMFNMYALSAAHRTLPFGTIIRVTNLDNLKSVNVKISDRGPFIKSRVLDVSFGAAKELDFVAQGTARVKIETLEAVRVPSLYTVQAAIFAEEENARLLKDRIHKKFEGVSIVPFETNLTRFFRVLVGSYASEEQADHAASKLMLEGLEPIVMRKD